jgi:hypothetical protein
MLDDVFAGIGNEDSVINDLQRVQVPLHYVTKDVRDIVNELGLTTLSVYYQILLMEYCYNFGSNKVLRYAKQIRGENPAYSSNEVIGHMSEHKMGKKMNCASFNVVGIKNLYALDRKILVADYNVRLHDLSNLLNNIHPEILLEWLEDVEPEVMPILILKLEKLKYAIDKKMSMLGQLVIVDLPQYRAISEKGRAMLQEALEEIRLLEKMEEK